MKVKINYVVDVDDDFRRAINLHYGEPGLASSLDVKRWFEAHGHAASDDLMWDLQQEEKEEEDA